MIEVEPVVRLIAEPVVDTAEMLDYLREAGGEEWYDRVVGPHGQVNHPETLIEFCGRLCYRSWAPQLNRNVRKIREDSGAYLLNLLTSGHGSVLEHAAFSFLLRDVSRVATAELNRHRAGAAVSEQSLRYVRLDEVRFRSPPGLPPEVLAAGRQLVEDAEAFLRWAASACRLDDEGVGFAEKKRVTSALRRYAPMGLATEEVWTANLRAIRHVVEMRTAPGAEEEIRLVADQVARIMRTRAPFLFGDYVVDAGAWDTPNRKV